MGQPCPSVASEPSWGCFSPWRNSSPAGGSVSKPLSAPHNVGPNSQPVPRFQASFVAAPPPTAPRDGAHPSLPPSWWRTPIPAQPGYCEA